MITVSIVAALFMALAVAVPAVASALAWPITSIAVVGLIVYEVWVHRRA